NGPGRPGPSTPSRADRAPRTARSAPDPTYAVLPSRGAHGPAATPSRPSLTPVRKCTTPNSGQPPSCRTVQAMCSAFPAFGAGEKGEKIAPVRDDFSHLIRRAAPEQTDRDHRVTYGAGGGEARLDHRVDQA